MATEAVVAEVDEGEVPLSAVEAIQDEGLSNGLGLERLLPAPTNAKTKATKSHKEIDAEDEAGEDTGEPKSKPGDTKDEKKVAKDPKTGRFL